MANKKGNKSYYRGKHWGRKTIIKEYEDEGDKAIHRCYKTCETCKKYAKDMKLKKNKNGKDLTPDLRNFYSGIVDGMLDGYNKIKF